MYDWLIIGGGIHGTHLSHVLTNGRGADPDRVGVVDPHHAPLARWHHCTTNTGMQYLRSPAVHHIGLEPMGLLRFARSSSKYDADHFSPPYDRPSRQLFDEYCRRVIERGNLRQLQIRGRVEDLSRHEDGFSVDTDRGCLKARRVIVATGSGHRPRWPEWAGPLADEDADIWHIFDDQFDTDDIDDHARVGICGLGISAAQTALKLADDNHREVTVFARHDVRIAQFDSPPCWLGPKCQIGFRRHTYPRRRQAIRQARQNGTMPRNVARRFEQICDDGHIQRHVGDVTAADVDDGQVVIDFDDGSRMQFDALILATGFAPPCPDDDWLGRAADRMDLQRAPCGFPIVDRRLRWGPDLFVTGPLAELELGPAARNIAGARMTARRLEAVSVA